eukprot:g35476.t1
MDNKEMADQLNKYFGSVFTKEDKNNLQEMLGDRGLSKEEELKEILISQEMVLGKFMGLKPDKPQGLLLYIPEYLRKKADYYLNRGSLGKGEVHRDLGVMVDELLKVGMQLQQAVRKANGMLAFIARGFEHQSEDFLLQLYRSL